MPSKRETILSEYEEALEEESQRHQEVLRKAKEACLLALKRERQGVKTE